MKRIFTVLFALVMAVSLCLTALAQSDVKVTLNGNLIDCESYGSPATIVEGRTLVPLRAIFEALGASVEWDNVTRTVTSKLDTTEIKLTVGQNTLYKNGEAVTLDVPASIINNRTMVPARAIAESYGVKVEWDAKTRTVILTKEDAAKSHAVLVDRKSDADTLPKITVYRATASAETDENGEAFGIFKGMDITTNEKDYFINYIGKAELADKDTVMSIKVKPNDTVREIVFATGSHVAVSEAIAPSMLTPDVWNKLTLVYKPSESKCYLYINDNLHSSKQASVQNNTLRILFRYATKIGDSYMEFDDYTVYSGDVAIPAVSSEKYKIENLSVNGIGNDNVGTILENLKGGLEGYTMIITDKNGNKLNDADKVDSTCALSVCDGDITIETYALNPSSLKFENASVSAGHYILPTLEYGNGDMVFSVDYSNFGEKADVKVSAVLYGNQGKALKKLNEASVKDTLGEKGTLSVSLKVDKSAGTYVEFNVFDAKTNEQLCAPIAFNGHSNEKIEYAIPLYEGFTTKSVCFNYDDAVWQDSILVEYLNKYGIKATFNLQGSNVLSNIGSRSGKTDEKGKLEYVKSIYEGHEIACHSMTHIPACFNENEVGYNSAGIKLVGVDAETLIKDTVDCPVYLREKLGGEAIGLAWPQGYATRRNDYNSTILPAIKEAGIKYARAAENGSFALPKDWYVWNATCHHNDAPKYTDLFIGLENSGEMKCFFNWGHSYEFENNKNDPNKGWTMIEGVMQKLAAEEDIWKATNGDIYKYVEATKLVEITEKSVKNNSDMTLYFNINGENVTLKPGKVFSVK